MSTEKKMQLLREWNNLSLDPRQIRESREKNGGKIILKGIIQRAEAVNQNGRIYPRPILEREIRNYQKLIRERRALGEADHPDSSVVELKNVSHLVTEAHFEGNEVWGTVELLDTPNGKILQTLVESGVTLGISSRGVGSVKREGNFTIVDEDFQLIAFDCVAEPSTNLAFLMREGREVTAEELRQVFTKSDRVNRILEDILQWRTNKS